MFHHIWKSGGTTIGHSAEAIGGGWPDDWEGEHQKRVSRSLDARWFQATLVNDPLSRSLSGFHEIMKRIVCLAPVGVCGMGGGDDCVDCQEGAPDGNVSEWISKFEGMLAMPPDFVNSNLTAYLTVGIMWHILPQLGFLSLADGSKIPLDYIGTVGAGMEDEFHFIFDTQAPLVSVGAGDMQDTDYFRIKPAQLPSHVILQVCDYYYVDYCCFGYDFPDECKTAGFSC
jgi:hypothetical protein